MVVGQPEYAGEEHYFPVGRFLAAQRWVEAGGISLLVIAERSGGTRRNQVAPHLRIRGPVLQMEAWAARAGRPWSWVKREPEGTVYFEMSGRAAEKQLRMFGIKATASSPVGPAL